MRIETNRRRYDKPSDLNYREEETSRSVSDKLHAKKRKKRRGNRCVQITAAFCVAHVFRHFFLFFAYTDDYLNVLHYPEEFSPPTMISPERKLSNFDDSKSRRRSRTTPSTKREGLELHFSSLISGVEESANTETSVMDRDVTMDSTYPSYPITDYIAGDDICRPNNTNVYNMNDRVVIAGILSHPVAAELAIKLAEGCGVRHIFGISNHLLSTEESARLEFLLHEIPSLQIKFGRGSLGSRATDELFESFSPSHVFYFHEDFDEENPFVFRSRSNQLEQICNTIVKMNFKSAQKDVRTRLLFVTSHLPEANKSSLSVTIATIMLGTYRAKYHLYASVLHLPYIFGPFTEGSLWLRSDDFVDRVNEIVGRDQSQYQKITTSEVTTDNSFGMSQPIMSTTDAIRSILISGKWGDIPDYESIPILSAQKFQTTLMNLSENLMPLVKASFVPNIKSKYLDTSFLPILSWNYKKAKPYRDPTDFDTSPIENDKIAILGLNNTRHHFVEEDTTEMSAFSQLERRQHNLFPCISVCASQVECKSSAWDPVVPIVKMATKDCKFMLYTTDFSRNLKELPSVRDSVNTAKWPRESFCQLAFVSSTSAIVNDAIQKEGDDLSRKIVEEWNGRVSNNGWTLVWVDKDEESFDQADSMIPKIIPESIVSPNVEVVFYIEPEHYKIVPPLQLWFEMSKHMVAAAEIRDDYLIPERRIAFFAHAYNESAVKHLDVTESDYISKAVKLILEQNNKMSFDEVQNFQTARQRQAYSSSLMWQKEELEFELIDSALMMYKVHDIRARQFRCEWYEEQLFWSNENNRNLEGLSLSFVLNRWRRRGRLLRNAIEEKWGEMMLLGENGEELSPSVAELKISRSLLGDTGQELSPSDAEATRSESSVGAKGEDLPSPEVELKEFASQSDPQHYLKILNAIKVRKVYSSE